MNQPEKIDVHGYERQIEIQRSLLEKAQIKDDNRQLIKDFINFCEVDPKVGLSRVRLYYYTLRRLAELTDKIFREMAEVDIINLLAKLKEYKTCICKKKQKNRASCKGMKCQGKRYSEQSLLDFRKAISKFWRWLYFDQYCGQAPPQIRRIKCGALSNKKEPDVYSKEEIKALIDGMTTIRDKAFFSCLYDLQCRVSELLSRQIKHLRYTEGGDIQILIEAEKTQISHWETLFESVPQFVSWQRLHPMPFNPNAPLWTVMKKSGNIVPLHYPLVRKIFLNACKRQNIRLGKRNSIHMIRKSKATHDMADGIPITFIESRGSWTKGSRALQNCYLSVIQKDKDNAYKKKYGIPVNNGHEIPMELKTCTRCHVYLENAAKFCHTCGFPTDRSIMAKMQEISKATAELVDKDMLSEMIKKIVMAELEKDKGAKSD
ncbi:MAG: tyrosine-type recombinase/integrase [Candidatus Aenigmarchaeota archaeon]|nr:tyrosine-type recombinase/integrase [Candidatus Aenigmarchaeota archaeon]